MEAEPSNPPEVYKNAAGFAPPVVTTTVSAGGRTYVNLDSKIGRAEPPLLSHRRPP